jgi:hypothetical protein
LADADGPDLRPPTKVGYGGFNWSTQTILASRREYIDSIKGVVDAGSHDGRATAVGPTATREGPAADSAFTMRTYAHSQDHALHDAAKVLGDVTSM